MNSRQFLITCALLLGGLSGTSQGAASHSTYSGYVGDAPICAVLEFRDDDTIKGAYVVANEFTSEDGSSFPLYRIEGKQPGKGLADIELHKGSKLVASGRVKKGVGSKSEVSWTGILTTSNGEAPEVCFRRIGTEKGPAWINSISDDAHREWLNNPSIKAIIARAAEHFKLPPNWKRDSLPWEPLGWSNMFDRNLFPKLGDPLRFTGQPFRAKQLFRDARYNAQSATGVELLLAPDGLIEDYTRNNKLVSVTVPWNANRDGQFPIPPKETIIGAEVSETGEVILLWFPGDFVDTKVRLNNSGQIELMGALFPTVGDSNELDLSKPCGPSVIIRPRWWNGSRSPNPDTNGKTIAHEGWLAWSSLTGFALGPTDAGSGGVAMEAIRKLPPITPSTIALPSQTTGPTDTDPSTDWIPTDPWNDWKTGDGVIRPSLGKESIKGLHPFKRHPEFYIPWNYLMGLPG
jgi:hypothetical protein